MYYIGLGAHKKTISHCVKNAAGHAHSKGKNSSTPLDRISRSKRLPEPRMIAVEAAIIRGLDLRSPHSTVREAFSLQIWNPSRHKRFRCRSMPVWRIPVMLL